MYEIGPIRPPSEANSLLVRVTRNCPWNKCLFCPAYKGAKFSKRTVDEVKSDIDEMYCELSSDGERIRSVFLQDADSLVMSTDELLQILDHIRKRFPKVERITSYSRAKTVRRKSIEELKQLKEAGLTRLHLGMESGSDEVLKLMRKGITKEDIIQAGLKVKESGIELSEYIMPGLGGKDLSETHAKETAEVLNIIEPQFIRVRTFALHPLSPINELIREGKFKPLNDEEIVREIRLLIVNLREMRSYFSSADFSLNLLMDLDGFLDEKKDEMLKLIDRFLSLDDDKKKAYSLLRRYFIVSYPLDVLENKAVYDKLSEEVKRIERGGKDFYAYIRELMSYQLPNPLGPSWN